MIGGADLNFSYYVPFFLMLFLILMNRRRRRIAAVCKIIEQRKRKGVAFVEELAKRFIGKDCLVYTISDSSSTVQGIIREVSDGGMLIEGKNGMQLVSLAFVTRIREYPTGKNGKKKSIVLD